MILKAKYYSSMRILISVWIDDWKNVELEVVQESNSRSDVRVVLRDQFVNDPDTSRWTYPLTLFIVILFSLYCHSIFLFLGYRNLQHEYHSLENNDEIRLIFETVLFVNEVIPIQILRLLVEVLITATRRSLP